MIACLRCKEGLHFVGGVIQGTLPEDPELVGQIPLRHPYARAAPSPTQHDSDPFSDLEGLCLRAVLGAPQLGILTAPYIRGPNRF